MYFLTVIVVLIVLFIYFLLYRPWQLRWGATDDEVNRYVQRWPKVKIIDG